MNNNKEMIYLYYIKAITILSVVIGHIATPFSGFIYSWHIPIFFIISGFTINTKKTIKNYLFDSFKRLMIPYYIFAVVGLGAEILKRYLLGRSNLNLIDELIGIFYYMNESHLHHYGFILWFLPALFFSRVLVYFLLKKIPDAGIKKDTLLIFIFFIITFFSYNKIVEQIPFGLDKIFVGGSWIILGYFINKYIINKINWGYKTILLAILIFISLVKYLGIPIVNISGRKMIPVIYSHFYIISFLFLLLSIFIYFTKDYTKNVIKKIAQNTMFIYIFHIYTNNICYYFVIGNPEYYWISRSLFSVVAISTLVYLYDKYWRWKRII